MQDKHSSRKRQNTKAQAKGAYRFDEQVSRWGNQIADIGIRATGYLLFALAVVLLIMNLACFAYLIFNTETVVYEWGISIPKILYCAGAIGLLYWLYHTDFLKRVPLSVLEKGLYIFIASASVLWIFMTYDIPKHDPQYLLEAAEEFLRDDYRHLTGADSYFQRYPYQLPFTFFVEQVYRITGPGRHMLIKLFNICCMIGIYRCMAKISYLFLSDEKDKKIAVLLLFTCWQPIFWTTFTYPLTPSLFCIFLSVSYFLTYLHSAQPGKISTLLFSGLCLGLAILLKSNMWISWIALGIVIFLVLCKQRNWKILLVPLVSVLLVTVGGAFINLHYESRSGIPIGKGTPGIVWIAMGLQESGRAPGWYNGFPPSIMKSENYDLDAVSEVAGESIKDSLRHFANHPKYMLEFFIKKEVSQWCEPTWECFFFSSAGREHEKPLNHLTNSVYNGTAHQGLLFLFHGFQIIWIFGFVCALFPVKGRKVAPESLILPLAILGGFLCHTFWEGKSQYIFPYYMMMLPCAIQGYSSFFSRIQEKAANMKQAPAVEK